jgi:hypothetical protein
MGNRMNLAFLNLIDSPCHIPNPSFEVTGLFPE